MTAEEFKNKNALLFLANPEKIMVEFAQYHVKQALEAAAKNYNEGNFIAMTKEKFLKIYEKSNII